MSAIKIRLADVSEGPQVVEMINAAFKDESSFLPIERNLKWWNGNMKKCLLESL